MITLSWFRTMSFLSLSLFSLILLIIVPTAGRAQQYMTVYDDALQNGWQPYGYPDATIDYASTGPTRSGRHSIAVTAPAYEALYIHHAAFDTSHYTALVFWVNGADGGQSLRVQATRNGVYQSEYYLPDPLRPSSPLRPNEWHQVVIPLSDLGVGGVPDMDGFWIMNNSPSPANTFYVDDISLRTDAPTDIQVQAGQVVRGVDDRFFGLNLSTIDSYLNPSMNAGTAALLGRAGISATTLRWPGGSLGDRYHWAQNLLLDAKTGDPSTAPYEQAPVPLPTFANLAAGLGDGAYLTVNYGSGTPQEAAALVAYVNGDPGSAAPLGVDTFGTDWGTVGKWASFRAAAPISPNDGMNFLRAGHPTPYGFHYFEIGNEVWGASWECDLHGAHVLDGKAHDPVTYGTKVADFWGAMKAVDSSIKIGVVAEYGTGFDDWNRLMLLQVAMTGIVPDFTAQHWYTNIQTSWYHQRPGLETDEGLFASNDLWASNAQTMRGQLETAFPASKPGVSPVGDAVEMIVTENNSVYDDSGKQAVSLTDGLYLADSIGHALQTGYNGLLWWDLRDYQNTRGTVSDGPPNLDDWLYGWRPYGDFGMINTTGAMGDTNTTLYPTFYVAKLLKHFARGGDLVVQAASGDPLLSAFAAKRSDGSLSLLVVNKSKTLAINAAVGLTGFVPTVDSKIYAYGILQDSTLDPASSIFGQYPADVSVADFAGAAPSFTYQFSPYSVTLLSMLPMPTLALLNISPEEVTGGATAFGTVKLTSPAPTNGVTVALTCSGAAGNVPTSVTIPAGHVSQSFSVATSPVAQPTILAVTALLNGTPQTATLTVSPPALASLTFPSPVPGGTVVAATVTLSGITPSDVVVGLSSSDSSVVRVHRAVIIPAGSSSAKFEINTYRSHTTKTVAIQATLGQMVRSSELTITGR